jgi:GNAT superfamily N-acetyltransferase
MYIYKEYRGKGIGRKLFEKAFTFCKNNKYNRIMLCTYPQMKEAIKFYKKNGFREFKRKGQEIYFEKFI